MNTVVTVFGRTFIHVCYSGVRLSLMFSEGSIPFKTVLCFKYADKYLYMQRGRPRSQPQCVTEFMDRQCMYALMRCVL